MNFETELNKNIKFRNNDGKIEIIYYRDNSSETLKEVYTNSITLYLSKYINIRKIELGDYFKNKFKFEVIDKTIKIYAKKLFNKAIKLDTNKWMTLLKKVDNDVLVSKVSKISIYNNEDIFKSSVSIITDGLNENNKAYLSIQPLDNANNNLKVGSLIYYNTKYYVDNIINYKTLTGDYINYNGSVEVNTFNDVNDYSKYSKNFFRGGRSYNPDFFKLINWASNDLNNEPPGILLSELHNANKTDISNTLIIINDYSDIYNLLLDPVTNTLDKGKFVDPIQNEEFG